MNFLLTKMGTDLRNNVLTKVIAWRSEYQLPPDYFNSSSIKIEVEISHE